MRTCPAREFAPRIHGCAGLGSLPSCGKFLMKFYVRLRRLRGPEAMYAPPGPATCPLTRAGFIPREDDFTGGGSRTLPPRLPGRDRCRPGVLGAVSKSRRRSHPPSPRSRRSLCCRPRLRSVSTPSPSPPRCPQEVCKPRLMYDGNRNLASVRSSCRRASLPPCTARHHYDCMLPVDCVGVGVSAWVPASVRAVVALAHSPAPPTL